jgi:hypothetical protein
MTWLRLEAAYFSHPQTLAVGFWGSQVYLAGMTMAKLHNWRGCIPKGHFTPEIIARHLNLVTVSNGVKHVGDGLSLCVKHGLLVEDATHYVIPSWRKYQPDPTSNARQEKFRSASKVRRAKGGVTGRNGDKRYTPSVTPRLLPTEEGGVPPAPSGPRESLPIASPPASLPASRIGTPRDDLPELDENDPKVQFWRKAIADGRAKRPGQGGAS